MTLSDKQYEKIISGVIKAALAEDIDGGDITTDAIVPKNKTASAKLIAKEPLVPAGIRISEKVFKTVDRRIKFTPCARDGKAVKKGATLAKISGNARAILKAERTALNFLQRLSGIATLTAEFVERTKGTKTKILDTRKTTPCMRIFEKYAVLAGGGANHRFGLFDAILIKDNHIAIAGGIEKAVIAARKRHGDKAVVEVETKNLKQVKDALGLGVQVIMLDNMGINEMKKAIRLIGKKARTEISGGVNLNNIKKTASLGPTHISIGALTHSARAMDISLEVD
ncbi:MAG: carboxylating nicotinate-nucleotide diphosphorylase [Thermodesulfobacteriota bacterium]